jgi:hypothetical protein
VGEPFDGGQSQAAAAALALEPQLELGGLEIVQVAADADVFGVVEVVLEDEILDLVRERPVGLFRPRDGMSPRYVISVTW